MDKCPKCNKSLSNDEKRYGNRYSCGNIFEKQDITDDNSITNTESKQIDTTHPLYNMVAQATSDIRFLKNIVVTLIVINVVSALFTIIGLLMSI